MVLLYIKHSPSSSLHRSPFFTSRVRRLVCWRLTVLMNLIRRWKHIPPSLYSWTHTNTHTQVPAGVYHVHALVKQLLLIKWFNTSHAAASLRICSRVHQRTFSCHGFKNSRLAKTPPLKETQVGEISQIPSLKVWAGSFCQLRNNNSRYCEVRERSVRAFLIQLDDTFGFSRAESDGSRAVRLIPSWKTITSCTVIMQSDQLTS